MRSTGTVLALSGLLAAAATIAAEAPLAAQQPPAHMNKMVRLLAQGKVVFGSFADDRSPDGAARIARDPNLDFVFYDMEHSPFDVPGMRVFLQFLLDPAAIARNGGRSEDHPVLVRIPANGREMNQWMIKNILDQGAHGIVVPHVETVEQALNVVRAMRYPQKPGAPDAEPVGQRGSGPGNAIRYWGVSREDYQARADLWPLDPRGELVSILLIENQLGVANVRAIAQVKGVSVISAAPGDLSVSYAGDRAAIEDAIQTVLAACKAFDVPCAITAGVDDVETRIKQGFRVIIASGEAIRKGRQVAGR
jgi:4-hydroxy-2-oxoheptanedioate aldolase